MSELGFADAGWSNTAVLLRRWVSRAGTVNSWLIFINGSNVEVLPSNIWQGTWVQEAGEMGNAPVTASPFPYANTFAMQAYVQTLDGVFTHPLPRTETNIHAGFNGFNRVVRDLGVGIQSEIFTGHRAHVRSG